MDRRNFLRSLIGGVAVAAAAPAFPFRVFSFPSEIVIAPTAADMIVIGNPIGSDFMYSDALKRVYEPLIREQLNCLDLFHKIYSRAMFENVPGYAD